MKSTHLTRFALLAGALAALPPQGSTQDIYIYRGYCDASAAAALDKDHFVVANDERNVLQIYRHGDPATAGSVPLWDFLGTDPGKESDIEAAATVGSRIYWISSHGRNSQSERQQRRLRIFATDIVDGMPPTVRPTGKPYAKLLDALLASDAFKQYGLEAAAGKAPEELDGLNIEGLAVAPDAGLLIGFRNPIPAGNALIITLRNPNDVVAGGAPRFGAAYVLNLGGRGIRSIEKVRAGYLLIAGPADDHGDFALYRWSGKAEERATEVSGIDFKDLRPEAMFASPVGGVHIISDDGKVKSDGIDCRERDAEMQTFRSMLMKQ